MAPLHRPFPQGLRVLGYGRVSTADQATYGGSFDTQHPTIEAECERRGWTLLEIIDDTASGKSLTRPGIRRALELLDAGEADVLMAAKLDRLSRSVLDFASLMERAAKKGWDVVVLDFPVGTDTPMGRAMLGVASVFAQLERELISQRTRETIAAKRAAGTLRGPIGRQSQLPEAVRVRIVEAHGAGASPYSIAQALNDDQVPTGQGGARWYPSSVRKVLTSAGVELPKPKRRRQS